MGLMSSLGLVRGAIPALGGVSREIARTIAPDLARGLADAIKTLPPPPPGALPPARPGSGYDRLIDAVNRLPRPLMAFGTQALMLYALLDPAGFALRMEGLDAMPEAMWWLLGAVITAYFGAREAHHLRSRRGLPSATAEPAAAESPAEAWSRAGNPALEEWRNHG